MSPILTTYVFPYINFIVFFAILIIVGRKPIASMVAKRREDYDKLLAEASAAKRLAEERSQELKSRLEKLDQELSEIKQSAIQSAEAESKQMIEGAKKLADHLKDEASRIAQTEISNARLTLQREIVDTVKKSVSDKIASDLGDAQQQSIFKSGADKLKNIEVGVH